MSWVLEYDNAEEFRNDHPLNPLPADTALENQEQAKVARSAAIMVLDSKACGKRDVMIRLSGHANPDHEPVFGWSNDNITITVVQKGQAKPVTLPPSPVQPVDNTAVIQ